MCRRFGTIKMLILSSLDKQLMNSIGKNTNVNEKVNIFNSTILNILSNFIPHKFLLCSDKDPDDDDQLSGGVDRSYQQILLFFYLHAALAFINTMQIAIMFYIFGLHADSGLFWFYFLLKLHIWQLAIRLQAH